MYKKRNILMNLLEFRSETIIAINLGACIPNSCPVHILEVVINNILKRIPNLHDKITVKIPENTCQSEEIRSSFRTIDISAM